MSLEIVNDVLAKVWPIDRTGGVALEAEMLSGGLRVIARPAACTLIDVPKPRGPVLAVRVALVQDAGMAEALDGATSALLREWHESFEWRRRDAD